MMLCCVPTSRVVFLSGILIFLLSLFISAAVALGQSMQDDMIAYVAITTEGGQEIFLVDVRTRQTANLTRHPANERDPAWSPDGERLVFVSSRDEVQRIFTMNALGGELFLLTPPIPASRTDYMPYQFPNWSADGERVLYLRDAGPVAPQPGTRIFSVRRDGTQVRRIDQSTPDGQHYIETIDQGRTVSPDGQQIYASSEGEFINLYLTDGEETRILYVLGTIDTYISSSYAWSPDGSRVAFAVFEDGLYRLKVIDIHTGQVQTLVSTSDMVVTPVWRP